MIRLALTLAALLSSVLAAQSQEPGPSSGGGDAPGQAQAANPAVPEDAVSAPKARSPEMQVSQTDAAAGENERNENVAVAPVDLNILKDLLVRIGTTATLIPQFLPDIELLRLGIRRRALHRAARSGAGAARAAWTAV